MGDFSFICLATEKKGKKFNGKRKGKPIRDKDFTFRLFSVRKTKILEENLSGQL